MSGLPIEPPGVTLLSECAQELDAIFKCMTVTSKDRATREYAGWLSLSPPTTQFHDQIEYAERCYLRDAATKSMKQALRSGHLKVVTDDETHITVPLNGAILFAPNKCNMQVALSAGVYRPMNVFRDFGDDRRASADGRILWVVDKEWQRVRGDLVQDRTRNFGSLMESGFETLLLEHSAVDRSAAAEPPDVSDEPESVRSVAIPELRRFCVRVKLERGTLPHVTRTLLQMAKQEFAPRTVTRSRLQAAVRAEGLDRPQSRPRNIDTD